MKKLSSLAILEQIQIAVLVIRDLVSSFRDKKRVEYKE